MIEVFGISILITSPVIIGMFYVIRALVQGLSRATNEISRKMDGE
jgi:hypothetical protein